MIKLNERQKEILTATVKTYILTGEPVGSKMLCEVMPVQVSSATVRAVLSDLCEMGFLSQPHTSAGRVPTALGYRFYIERLINNAPLSEEDKHYIDSVIGSINGSTESELEQACESLASMTGCAAMLTSPCDKGTVIRKVKLISIGSRTVMVVVAAANGIIKNRVAKCEMSVSDEQLERAETAICDVLIGINPDDLSAAVSQQIICRLGGDMLLLMPVVAAAVAAAQSVSESELKLKGESNLFIHNDFSEEGALKILDYLQNRSRLMQMFKSKQDKLTVLFGSESSEFAPKNSGVIIANYNINGKSGGSIGILGPERMDYSRIIPRVMYFRDELQKHLSDGFDDNNDF